MPSPLFLCILLLSLSLFSPSRSQSPLQPLIQTDPIPSSYTLLDEIKAWRPLSVFYNLLLKSKFSKIIPKTALRSGILIFAPINSAFARSLYVFFPEARRELTDEEILQFMLTKWQTDLVNVFAFWPDIRSICEYHSVPRNYSERQWSSLKEIITMYGSSRHLTPKFPIIYDHDHSYITKRLARQVETTTGRLNFVSNTLLPIDARTKFIEGGGPFIGEKTGTVNIFEPLLTLSKFIEARNDLMFLQAMLTKSQFRFVKKIIESEKEGKKLHVFLPNDRAFLAFVEYMFPEKYSDLVPKGEDTLWNYHAVKSVLDNLMREWARYSHWPQLHLILSYHFIYTQESLEDLQGAGQQKTAASKLDGKPLKLSVTKSGVKDNDESRPDAKLVTYYRTGTGNVTIVDAVLLPYGPLKFYMTPEPEVAPATPEPKPQAVTPSPESVTPEPEVAPATPEPKLQAVTPSPESVDEIESPTAQPMPISTDPEEVACFPGDALLKLQDRDVIQMKDLVAGYSTATDHEGRFDKVFLFSHREHNRLMKYLRITTQSGHVVELSNSHYLYANGVLTAAGSTRIGDILDTTTGPSSIVGLEVVVKRGIYAPHTESTDLIVNGIRVSAYTIAVHPRLAHALLAPVRWLARRGVKEPLGRLLYGGGRGLHELLPSGKEIFN